MKRLLTDYTFDDSLRYEAHSLIYRDADGIEIQLGGIMELYNRWKAQLKPDGKNMQFPNFVRHILSTEG
jgi:hypothetical protein